MKNNYLSVALLAWSGAVALAACSVPGGSIESGGSIEPAARSVGAASPDVAPDERPVRKTSGQAGRPAAAVTRAPDKVVARPGVAVEEPARAGGTAAPLSGRWHEVPDSRLVDVAPDPIPRGVEGVKGVMNDWSGGAFDTRRERLLVWGGGHAGYAGNEIYAFDIATSRWSIVWGPTPNEQIQPKGGSFETYLDGMPSARHTYDNIDYDPVHDALWSNDGSLWRTGTGSFGTWRFRFETGVWERLADAPRKNLFAQTGYDPVEKIMIKRENRGVYHYDLAADRWHKTTPGIWSHWHLNGEMHPVARKLVMVGGGRLEIYDLRTKKVTAVESTGATQILDSKAPGLAYHPPSGRIVAWSGGANLYALEVGDKRYHWSLIEARPGSAVPGEPNPKGTYGRFRYVPSIDAFVLVNTVGTNVFLFRLDN